MGKKVLTLAVKPPNAPNQRIIDCLREALKEAREGKVQACGIALAVVDEGNDADGGRATETILSFTPGWAHSLATAVNGMAFRLNYERYTQGNSLPPAKLDETDE
jgi:hypothetical protein